MKWFDGIKDIDALKAEYKKLCKKHHPDLNKGTDTTETMKSINVEYDRVMVNFLAGIYEEDRAAEEFEISQAQREMVEKLTVLDGLLIEVCGKWLWITGNTFENKSFLKSFGCFFSSKKVAWYWRPNEAKCSSKKRLSLQQIREKYGSCSYYSKQNFSLN